MRYLGFLFYSVLSLTAAVPAFAQNSYPDKPIRMVVPFAAGGPADVVARVVAADMSNRLGQQIIIENKTGAGGTVGTDYVAKSSPDGYTVLFVTIAHVISPAVYKSLPYDPVKDFTPIRRIGQVPLVLVVRKDFPANDVASFIAVLKQKPGQFNFGSAGNGSVEQLATAWFQDRASVKAVHIPYRGAALAIQDLVAGRLDFIIETSSVMLPHIASGAVKALAVANDKRISTLPAIPTMAEAGVSDFNVAAWYGLLGPSGIPLPISERLNTAISTSLNDETVRKRLSQFGVEVAADTSSAEFARFIVAELGRWMPLMKAVGVEPQ
jgi:tripartite-type tricarboxylate transporter receptor subunit TctC